MVIVLQAPVPAAPPDWVAFGIVFEDGCRGEAGPPPGPTNKEVAAVFWDPAQGRWQARWRVITNCNPRTVITGPAIPASIEDNVIRMRVPITQLLSWVDQPVRWHAVTRRLEFAHPVFTFTTPVDVAPNVFRFNPSPPPPILPDHESATWSPNPQGPG